MWHVPEFLMLAERFSEYPVASSGGLQPTGAAQVAWFGVWTAAALLPCHLALRAFQHL
jgi:hypothetical protein